MRREKMVKSIFAIVGKYRSSGEPPYSAVGGDALLADHPVAMTIIDDWHDTADKWPLVPLMLGSFGIPYLIAYLSFDPSTRWLRIALWPFSIFCYFAALGRIGDPRMYPSSLKYHCADKSGSARYEIRSSTSELEARRV